MKKIQIVILAISLPILIFLIFFSIFELYKRFSHHNNKCLDQQTLNLPSEVSTLTQDLCVTTYATGKNSIHFEFKNGDIEQKLVALGWKISEPGTYFTDKYILNLSENTVSIINRVIEASTNTETDTSSPIQVIPQSTEYQITDKEISRINTTQKIVVFTFDGGSGTQSLDQILNILKKYSIKGTFFLTGKWAQANPNDVKRIHDAGYEIFNHTYSHPDLATVSDAQITQEFEQANTIISGLIGENTKPFFRPPYGSRNLHIRQLAASLGYQDVYWTIDALDWKESTGTTAETVKSRILDNLAPGNIYLMHIGDNLTGQVLEEVILNIQNQGYSIQSLYTAVTKYN